MSSYIEKDDELDIRGNEPVDSDVEDDEVAQDWSKVTELTRKNKTHVSIPKRGEKDSMPDGTDLQDFYYSKALDDMFEVLTNSVQLSSTKNLLKAYYVKDLHQAVIYHPGGNFLQTMGRVNSNGECWLDYYEFVYLVERGSVAAFYHNDNNDELPMKLKDLYVNFASQREKTQFLVYSHLRRLGFIVNRTKRLGGNTTSFYPPDLHRSTSWSKYFHNLKSIIGLQKKSLFDGIFYSHWNFWLNKYTSNAQLYRSLSRLIPSTLPPKNKKQLFEEKSTSFNSSLSSNYDISFDVWKPQTNFKKKSPGLPDYQVVVYDKNERGLPFPTLHDLQHIFRKLDYKFEFLEEIDDDLDWNKHSYTNGMLRADYLATLKSKAQQTRSSANKSGQKTKQPRKPATANAKQLYRLKNGYRSFLLAVMDDGLLSFIRIAEADFGSENVWYENPQKSMTG